MLPGERGQCVGRALLDAVSQRLDALGASEISLHVLLGNEDAARFYEREGFNPFAIWLTKSPATDEPDGT